MERQCPLCNGLTSVNRHCPHCHEPMVDTGRVAAYYDPYSAYLEQQLPEQRCVHLLACTQCGWDTRISVETVSI